MDRGFSPWLVRNSDETLQAAGYAKTMGYRSVLK
jgi:hypothetical protein